jgi:hypothetical protein
MNLHLNTDKTKQWLCFHKLHHVENHVKHLLTDLIDPCLCIGKISSKS